MGQYQSSPSASLSPSAIAGSRTVTTSRDQVQRTDWKTTPSDTSLLPPELLDTIFASLSANDLAQCLRVNSAFYRVIRPRIARRVRYIERNVEQRGARETERAERHSTWQDEEPNAPGDDPISLPSCELVGVPVAQPSLLPAPQSARFHPASVREVIIAPHSSATCAAHRYPSTISGHYTLVRLEHALVDGDPLYHTNEPYDGHLEAPSLLAAQNNGGNPATSGTEVEGGNSTCALLADVRCKTLVLHGLSGYSRGPPALPSSLTAEVENLIFVLDGGFVGLCDRPERAALFPTPNPAYPCLRSISIFFLPPAKGGRWCPPPIGQFPPEVRRAWFDRVLNALAASWFLYPPANVVFLIANADAIDPSLVGIVEDEQGIPGEYRRRVADVVQERFAEQWRRVVPPSAHRKELEGLKFVGLEHFKGLYPGAVDDE